MTTEIVKAEPVAANLPDMVRYAAELANANLLPGQYRKQPANVLYAMEYGRTLGITPLAAITGIHVIEGKPSASAALISGLVRQAGHKLRVRMDNGRAIATIHRSDDPDFEFRAEWDMDRAKNAGLANKDVWRKYPQAMLKARAITEVARDACEEVLFGLHYTPEELDARVGEDGIPLDAQVQQLRPAPADNDQWATPPAQAPAPEWVEAVVALTEKAEQATDPAVVRDLYRRGKEAGLLKAVTLTPLGSMELGAYLVARGKQLAAPAAKQEDGDEVIEGEVVTPAEEEAEAAEAELRAFAEQAGITGIDAAFELAKGVPLTEATADQIRSLLTELRGNAA